MEESILPSAFKNSDDDPPVFLKLPASNCPEEEFNLRLVTVLGAKSPVESVVNNGKHVVSVLSFATVIDVGTDEAPLITPLLIVIVVPSIFTPPRTVVEAVGKVYVLAPLITPLASILIEDPSTLTPPNTVVEAVGNVYCDVIYPDKSGGVYVNTPVVLL